MVLQCLAIFGKLSIYGFISFCKLTQGFANGLSQGLASVKSWFLARIHDGHFADDVVSASHPPYHGSPLISVLIVG